MGCAMSSACGDDVSSNTSSSASMRGRTRGEVRASRAMSLTCREPPLPCAEAARRMREERGRYIRRATEHVIQTARHDLHHRQQQPHAQPFFSFRAPLATQTSVQGMPSRSATLNAQRPPPMFLPAIPDAAEQLPPMVNPLEAPSRRHHVAARYDDFDDLDGEASGFGPEVDSLESSRDALGDDANDINESTVDATVAAQDTTTFSSPLGVPSNNNGRASLGMPAPLIQV